ncbi:MAG: transcriptional regulator [Candidatus Pseudobacter hemicellulosilyticus]|uniref:Transcriptional regulator n=1 Tax=Candidatus Pseudobacter hemicellulosilyticus TaxID=3121375 RepID=A0AAJ6BFP7_9BACT|nr:MAG: transcriptional regulator [Pseudobacter sp.]
MKTLGATLKEARERNGLTLRQVDKATGVSSAYLSQMENDHVKNPSAGVLYKLATLYGEQLNDLMRAAGVVKSAEVEDGKESKETILANQLAFYAKGLTEEDQEEVLEYIKLKIMLHNKKNG